MHIILGVLGLVVTILILLNRLSEAGLDVGWLNPFSWHRRRKYRLQHDLNPVFKLDSLLDIAALYLVGVAKIDGDITLSQKEALLDVFKNDFHLEEREAKQLLASSAHLIGNGMEFYENPGRAVQRNADKFTSEQVSSVLTLLHKIASTDGQPTTQQVGFIRKVSDALPKFKSGSKW